MKKGLAAAAVLAGVISIYLATGSVPDVPASWDVSGGNVETTCWTADVMVPCASGRFPQAVCPSIDDEIVRVRLRAPVDDDNVPQQFLAIADRAAALVDSYRETPQSCPGNGKVLELVGPADDGAACVFGDVTSAATGRFQGRCCQAGCSAASQWAVQCPAVEVAGHEGICVRRFCRAVRAGSNPPAGATAFCDARAL